MLYASSTIYHAANSKPALQKFDHAAIFLLIAGSYTPFVLVTLRGPWGWSLFGVVWGLAVVGVCLKFWYAGRFKLASTLIYLGGHRFLSLEEAALPTCYLAPVGFGRQCRAMDCRARLRH